MTVLVPPWLFTRHFYQLYTVGYSTSHYHCFYIQSTRGGACLHSSYKSPSAGTKTLIILRYRRTMRVFAKFVNNCHLAQLILVLL
ncbi:unnamed protein product [Clonostachys rosea f. rosea IK726]|uniref:Uncharacterized protein n=2 Tax=Bionectria ochroleuca TaxID=29856 RepID=A0A0B7K0S9_BIOOC|nr:unnamed protein product [Clonostachys rosea f. rosea IK726]